MIGLLDTTEPTGIDRRPDAAATMWRIGVCGVAIGFALFDTLLSVALEAWLPIGIAMALLLLAWRTATGHHAVLAWSGVVGLVGAAGYLAVSWTPWSLSCITDPGACNWGIDRYLAYVGGWTLVLLAPIVGAGLIGTHQLRPKAWHARWFADSLWICALATAIGAVLLMVDVNRYAIALMALITMGGTIRDSSGSRVFTTSIAIVLSIAIVVVIAGYGMSLALGCVQQGSCGWSWDETLGRWIPALVVAGSLGVSAAALFSRPATGVASSGHGPDGSPRGAASHGDT